MIKVISIQRAVDPDIKRVVCYGFRYIVPTYVDYVAIDEDGAIMGYSLEPEIVNLERGMGYWSNGSNTIEPFDMGTVTFEGNWKESLVRV